MEINKDSSNKKRLGRGLGSLLGEADVQGVADYAAPEKKSTEPAKAQALTHAKPAHPVGATQASPAAAPIDPENRIWKIAVDKLVPGIYQPRKNFEKESLQELADSIKQNGILQPIAVRKRQGGGYEIIAGERRWRAAQLAGLHEVPAIIKQVSDRDALQLALIENVQREDLDPVEEAESYQRLMDEFKLSQQEVAEKVGKERSTVANSLRLIQLPSEIKEMIIEKLISTGHAKVLLSISDRAQQIKMAKQIVEKGLSVRALEQTIKNLANLALAKKEEKGALDIDVATKLAKELADQLQKSLGTKVEINYKSGKGQVNIQFYSDDQLTQIYEKLKA
jgi:ParB family chromosome partitioning protein